MSVAAPAPAAPEHPFLRSPNATLLALAAPVLISMVAEPLTGLVDTAFVARLGVAPLAAMGAGTIALSSIFWIFNFLQIGTQTEVAGRLGAGEPERASAALGLALVLSATIGLALAALAIPAAPWIAAAMGADGPLLADATAYISLRALGAPAILVTLAAFGALRGAQDMRAPLLVAVGVNLLNVLLDALLVFGAGPVPALGVGGAALASSLSQWAGAAWAVAAALRRVGRPAQMPPLAEAGRLLRVGGDLFIRTGLLTGFLVLTTRAATLMGAEAGAAHQAIRQVWIFTALFLDAFAITGQSLVGYFLGAGQVAPARRVAALVCAWSVGVGIILGVLMLLGRDVVVALLVPEAAGAAFGLAWMIAALVQPLNALAFATDGVHWGTGDYRYLRNGMVVASAVALPALALALRLPGDSLAWIWLVTALWTSTRATLGALRIWPGIGRAPLGAAGGAR
ncbi:MATE family efflux transporter [Oscillochloris sp. ZM17-4]|uniref:MATE family efflux transporter n=1 Tax=Oscillochloris sp. ZM17-4 TaxID=2866714 RepID=UPI001C733460|nr:MATE family efflux transporter [Oscillochloris sp. ZM17-4]MBX0326673.1 MATE family efflux transporter [Oscillochloris sp. ZM17-4]